MPSKLIKTVGDDFLALLAPRRCPFCGVKDEGLLCRVCCDTLPWAAQTEDCAAALYYRDRVRSALLRFKFQNAEWLAKPFGILMAQAAQNMDFSPSCVVYVPSAFPRVFKRGYQHTRLLARVVARELGLPLRSVLRKTWRIKSQTTMPDDTARRHNMENAFRAVHTLGGERVLLCDDIRTSGATLEACRAALLNAGACEVRFLVLARREN